MMCRKFLSNLPSPISKFRFSSKDTSVRSVLKIEHYLENYIIVRKPCMHDLWVICNEFVKYHDPVTY